eukprot:TRINITY_DN13987_c0_g1_i1.p1 TRINITY_DN13987_c0_g1~~TRINITY_DN13987_c0_g1_i1.p1  ORF type:complete len:2752 (+),score=869.57 TRINITY_DN13987_c0_g1_i1:24-8279(+)
MADSEQQAAAAPSPDQPAADGRQRHASFSAVPATVMPPTPPCSPPQRRRNRNSLYSLASVHETSRCPVPPLLTVLRQMFSLILTSLKLHWRGKAQSFTEQAFPVVIVGFYCLLFVLVREYNSGTGGLDLYQPFPITDVKHHLRDADVAEVWFAFAPDEPEDTRVALRAAVERMRVMESLTPTQLRWFHNTSEMEYAVCAPELKRKRPFAAVSFASVLQLSDSCLNIGRRERMKGWTSLGQNFSTVGGVHYVMHLAGLPPPDYGFADIKAYFPAPTRSYADAGLLSLQAALDTAIAAEALGDAGSVVQASRSGLHYRRYPPPNDRVRQRLGSLSGNGSVSPEDQAETIKAMKARDSVIRRGGGPVLAVAFITLFATVAGSMVRQREDGHADCLMVMGLSPAAYSGSVVISVCLVSLPSCIGICFLLLETGALVRVDFGLLLVMLLCFVCSVASAAQLFSVAFTNSADTPMLSVVLYLTVVAAAVAIAECSETTFGEEVSCFLSDELTAASLLSPVALVLGFRRAVLLVNDEGGTLDWSTMSDGSGRTSQAVGLESAAGPSHDYGSTFKVSTALGMMVGDAFLYMLAAWYLSRVLHGGHGWLFVLDPSYWCPGRKRDGAAVPPLPPHCDHENVDERTRSEGSVFAVRNLTVSRPVPVEKRQGCCRRERRKVVDGLGLDMYSSQVLAIVGPEGKSTFLRAATGQIQPEQGEMYIGGTEARRALRLHKLRIGLCPQRGVFFEGLTVHENLILFAVIAGVPRLGVTAEAERQAREVDLGNQKDRFVHTLTPGQKRKLSVAIAFIGNPQFVFLDEPLHDMDQVSVQHIRELIRRRKRDCTVVFITHSMMEADLFADRIAVLLGGSVRCVGSSGFLRRRFGCGYLLTLRKDLRSGDLKRHTRAMSPSACIRESKVEVKVHIPATAVPELITVLEFLQDADQLRRYGCRRWGLAMNGLEDVYLRLLEEGDVQVQCPQGHRLLFSAGECDGHWRCSLWGRGCRSQEVQAGGRWRCDACEYDLCEMCWVDCAEKSEWTIVGAADFAPDVASPGALQPGGSFGFGRPVDPESPRVSRNRSQSMRSSASPAQPPMLSAFYDENPSLADRSVDCEDIRTSLDADLSPEGCGGGLASRRGLLMGQLSVEVPGSASPLRRGPGAAVAAATSSLQQAGGRRGGGASGHDAAAPGRRGLQRLPVGLVKLAAVPDRAAETSPTAASRPSDVQPMAEVLMQSAQPPSVLRQLRVLIMLKRMKMWRHNRRAVLFHVLLPLAFVVMGMLVLRLLPNAARQRPALVLAPAVVSPPSGPHQDGTDRVTVYVAGAGAPDELTVCPYPSYDPTCGWCSEDFVAFDPLSRWLPTDALLEDALTPYSQLNASGAAIELNGTLGIPHSICLWFNASSLHALPAVWNTYVNAQLSGIPCHHPALCRGWGGHNATLLLFSTVHNFPEGNRIENAMPVLSFGVVTAVGMAFLSSGFAGAVVNERMRGGRLLQQAAGVVPWVYWLSHYISDSVATVVITACVSAIMVSFDSLLHNWEAFSALVVVLLLYMQSSLVITYLVSHFFNSPWKAQSGIAAAFLCVMTVPLVLSISITSTGGTFLKNFSNLGIFICNPLYSLVNALLILTDFMGARMDDVDKSSDNYFDRLQQPLIGLSIQFGGGIALLGLYESRIPIKKWIKQKIPRPVGFYDDDEVWRAADAQEEEVEMEADVLAEKRQVASLLAKAAGGGPEAASDLLIHELRKSYRTRHEDSTQVHKGKFVALRSLNLRILPGEVFGLLGPAGAGKTTTMLMLAGALPPSHGEAHVRGHSILTSLGAARLRMGVCLQRDALIHELTVGEHIRLYATLRGLPEDSIAALTEELLSRLDLLPHSHTRVSELPASLSRRLALLLAFIGCPAVLVLDEPTAGMDLIGRKRAWAFVLSWLAHTHTACERKGQPKPTVFIASHSIEEVNMLCTRIGILVKGRLRCLGQPRDLRHRFGSGWALSVRTAGEQHAHAFTEWLRERTPGARQTSSTTGGHLTFHLPPDVQPSEVFRLLEGERAALNIEDYSVTQLSLEEVFRRAVRGSRNDVVLKHVPSLRVCILIVGTRGDVQPFLALSRALLRDGHRVRLATHHKFRAFVEEFGIVDGSRFGRVEFYGIGGDPGKLMQFMVENPDMVTINAQKIRENKEMMMDIFQTCWAACTENLESHWEPFVLDVIIANPPVQCHTHIAERLQVPVQVHFTMPWSPTSVYAHPLAMTDALGRRESYTMVEQMMWLGLGGKLNEFRTRTLGLSKLRAGAGWAHRLQIPHVYCMSESLLEHPTDWGPHISMAGFWFLDTGGKGGPDELKQFCSAGTRSPIYIGFGSIQTPDLGDVATLTRNVFEALRRLHVRDVEDGVEPLRAIVQCCEGGFFDGIAPPPGVGVKVWKSGVAHDWLFPLCSAVCHHGGAGTLSAGLRAGKPTVVVPFFGDQPFWGKIVAQNKLGACVPYRDALKDVRLLVDAFSCCQDRQVQNRAAEMGTKLQQEDGVGKGVKAFYQHLPLQNDGEKVTFVAECFENQRFYPLIGWSDTLFPTDRYAWSDKTGRMRRYRHGFPLPEGWRWGGEWEVDLNAWPSEGTGFQYAVDWRFEFHARHGPLDMVRRRRWVRRREYVGEPTSSTHRQLSPSPRSPRNADRLRRRSLFTTASVRRGSHYSSGGKSPRSRAAVGALEEELRALRAAQAELQRGIEYRDRVIAAMSKGGSPLPQGGADAETPGPQSPDTCSDQFASVCSGTLGSAPHTPLTL